ncbi:WXG100 family type VII secretion target [Amedibacillus sp. YH-ame10]
MSIKIQVDPTKLESGALRIEQQGVAYEKSYARLFQAVETMSAGWQGKDNQAFITQIQGFQSDFIQMATLMKEYSSFLKTSAKIYRETQNERTAQARRLVN